MVMMMVKQMDWMMVIQKNLVKLMSLAKLMDSQMAMQRDLMKVMN